ncbi:hypothetical protein [Candidatus Poriferisocius sp.]|uniref:hypothetical protein n=1 Tax=Candidatus Poriferisocius sp. TaxID=3101276 RepID=UPI003B51E2A6
MAKVTVTSTPEAISGLDADVWYQVENSGDEPIYLDELASAPTDPDHTDGFEVLAGNRQHSSISDKWLRERGSVQVQKSGDTEIYAWTVGADSTLVVRRAG